MWLLDHSPRELLAPDHCTEASYWFPDDPLTIKELKMDRTEGSDEPPSLESQEALSAPGTSASGGGKSVTENIVSSRLNLDTRKAL